MLQVYFAFTYDVIRLEEISIISLNVESIIILLSRMSNREQHSVIETSFAILASEMSVCFLGALSRVKESPNKDIRSTFIIHHLDIYSVEYADSHFEFLRRSRCDVILRHFIGYRCRDDVYPEFNHSLGNAGRLMV